MREGAHRDLVNFLTRRRKPARKEKLNQASICLIFKHRLIKFSVFNACCAHSINRGIMQNGKACVYIVKNMLMRDPQFVSAAR